MGASKYISDLWRSRQLYDMELLSNLRHWKYTTMRSLVHHTRRLQPADIPWLGQVKKDIRGANGMAIQFSGWFARTCTASSQPPYLPRVNHGLDPTSFSFARSISSRASNKQGEDTNEVRVRIGSPITGYGQESRNRAARQRIPNKVWTDEGGVEHVEVNFYIRGPHGSGKVFCEMFKDQEDKRWKFTYLIVEIRSPSPAQLILESYIPA